MEDKHDRVDPLVEDAMGLSLVILLVRWGQDGIPPVPLYGCKELLEHVSSYEHEGRPYCHLDYHEVCSSIR